MAASAIPTATQLTEPVLARGKSRAILARFKAMATALSASVQQATPSASAPAKVETAVSLNAVVCAEAHASQSFCSMPREVPFAVPHELVFLLWCSWFVQGEASCAVGLQWEAL